MKNICVVIHSRANYARVKSVLVQLKKNPDCKLSIIVGASGLLFKYGNVAEVIENDGFDISHKVFAALEGNDPVVMAKTTGLLMIELSQIFFTIKPDLVVTIADRHETLATAAAASYMNIPVCHIQGGELTGSIDDSVRHAITKLSHIHCVSTQKAFEIVSQLGEDPRRIFLTGCPALDLVKQTAHEHFSKILNRYFNSKTIQQFNDNFLLVLQHPNTLFYEQARNETEEILSAIVKVDIPTIWLWPNIDSGTDLISKRLREHINISQDSKIIFCRNFKPEEYVNLMRQSSCIVGNSSSGIREASLIGLPTVNVGSRQQNREVGPNVISVKFDSEEIYNSIVGQINHGKYPASNLYGDGESGSKIAEIIMQTQKAVDKEFIFWKK
jgi:UDP-hydrolysing UDP-N-acetyl-D-glucosamine 2-epimerase